MSKTGPGDIPPIENAYGESSVILCQIGEPASLLTSAAIGRNGDLSITLKVVFSGMMLTVPGERKPFLLDSLLRHVTPIFPEEASADDRLLIALMTKFAGKSDPFREIESFLIETNNPPQFSGWRCPV